MINYTHIYIDIYELYLNFCKLLPAKLNCDVSMSCVIAFVHLIKSEVGLLDEFYRSQWQSIVVFSSDDTK